MTIQEQKQKAKQLAQDCATKAAQSQRDFRYAAIRSLIVSIIEFAFAIMTVLAGVWLVTPILFFCAMVELNRVCTCFTSADHAYNEFMKLRDDCLDTLRKLEAFDEHL